MTTPNGVLTIADFLLARVEEIDQQAQKATQGRWKMWAMEVRADPHGTSNLDTSLPVARTSHEAGLRTFNAQHIAYWDPQRVLAWCDAVRKIVELHKPDQNPNDQWYGDDARCRECGGYTLVAGHGERAHRAMWPCPTISLFAAMFSDHPEYRSEWAP